MFVRDKKKAPELTLEARHAIVEMNYGIFFIVY